MESDVPVGLLHQGGDADGLFKNLSCLGQEGSASVDGGASQVVAKQEASLKLCHRSQPPVGRLEPIG